MPPAAMGLDPAAAEAPGRILVVEDDPDTRENFRDLLELDGYPVATAASARDALARDDWGQISAIILDRRLPDGSAEELLPEIKRRAPGAAVLIVTGYADLDGAVAALRQGAEDYLLKPVNPEVLRATLAQVHERRRLAREKERSEAALQALIESAPCMVVILRPDRTIAYFSPYAEELTGYAAQEVLDRDYFSLFLPEEAQAGVASEMRKNLEGAATRGYANPVLRKDGSRLWVVWNARRLADYHGQPAVLAVGHDITEIKAAQERTLQAERLAAIGQMVAALAHESRNSLQAIQWYLEVLAGKLQDRPEALDLVRRLGRVQERLRQLYEDLRSYAAPIHLEAGECRLKEVLEETWGQLEPARRGARARLRVSEDGPSGPCEVDRRRLAQVFRNVLENSLAACPEPVAIAARIAPAVLDGQPAVRVSLRDNGPGLSPEQRRRIFEPFFTTKPEGTGLGMAIARRIVEAHGGAIAVGEVASGTEIVVTLPRSAAQGADRRSA